MPGLGTEEVLKRLQALDHDLTLRPYYSEEAILYNPGEAAPFGVIFATVKDHDGPNDKASDLSRAGVYRLAFQLSRAEYEDRFGPLPARPPKGGTIATDLDLQALDLLTPHPVYGWMRWAQVLSPRAATLRALEPLFEEALVVVRQKWSRRKAA
ncbi:MAG TPA: DUF6194 family protein [Solirubrobacterales bacterium]|nr:DUF6194 family protein [Solirubrobacterales bacterium]